MFQVPFLFLLTSTMPVANITTSVDPSVQYQVWEGFGTSLAWWASVVGGYSEPLRTTLVKEALGDLKLNVLRYNIGGGEAPGLNYMEPRARVPGFMSADGTYNWSADEAQRWVLAKGIKLGANKFEAFSNSPPYFMTVSGSVTGAEGGGNNLKPERVDDFSKYLTTVVKHFKDRWGVKFETLDPMNEPAANWWKFKGRQEGCHVTPGLRQSSLVISTGKALALAGLDTTVSACDESLNNWAVTSWDALSSEAKSYVSRINTHCYGGTAQHQVNQRAVRDTKRLWMSEYGDGDASGMQMAHQIVTDLRVMMPTAWVYWQVIDGGSGWGCIDMDLNAKSQTYKINQKYYAFSQFTKFIRPGAKFISIGDSNSVCALNGSQLVIVTVSDSDQTSTYDLSRFTKLGKKAMVYQTSATEKGMNLPAVQVKDGSLTLDLPAKSITTMVINGCSFAGKSPSGFQK